MDSKDYEGAKAIFQQLAQLERCHRRRNSAIYNLACCEALLGNIDSALNYLAQAMSNGFRNVEHIINDEDLTSLRVLPAFQTLISEFFAGCNTQTENENENENENRNEVKSKSKRNSLHILQENKPEVVKSTPEVVIESVVVPEPTLIVVSEDKVEIPYQQNIQTFSTQVLPVVEDLKEVDTLVPSNLRDFAFRDGLASLIQMGFTNVLENIKILNQTKGDLAAAVEQLLTRSY